jgi:hypothetical protein
VLNDFNNLHYSIHQLKHGITSKLVGKDASSNVFMALKEMRGEIASAVKQGDAQLARVFTDKLDSLESSLSRQNDEILSAIQTVSQRLSSLELEKPDSSSSTLASSAS